MPNAVTAIFGGDSRPLESTLKRMDTATDAAAKAMSRHYLQEISKIDSALQKLPDGSLLAQKLTSRRAVLRSFLAVPTAGEMQGPDLTGALRASVGAGETAGTGFLAGFLKKLQVPSGGASQLVHVFRATFDSLASGMNPWRVFLQQAPQAGQALATISGSFLSLLLKIVVPLGAIGAIIGSVIIYMHRVKKLTDELKTSFESAFSPDHIGKYLGKLSILEELQKNVTEETRRTQEAHDSVAESMQRQLELTKDRIGFERELLELQKANELANAKTPQERERIEKKYSAMILAKKKEERDAELESMKNVAGRLPLEIMQARSQIKELTGGGSGFMSDAQESQLARKHKEEADAAKKYFESGGQGEQDRKLVSELLSMQRGDVTNPNIFLRRGPRDLSDTEQAQLSAAQSRIQTSLDSKSAADAFEDSKGDRDRQRARVKELQDKILADEKKLAELGDGSTGQIHDTAAKNLQRDQEDLALEKERLRRTNSPGGSERNFGLNAQQRIGAYAATPPDFRKLVEAAVRTAHNTEHLKPGSFTPVGSRPPQFGARSNAR